MNWMIDLIKGVFIGVANVIPGLSGGTIAVLIGVYDRLIGGISDILKRPKEVLKDLFFLMVGLVLGIVLALYVIVFFLETFPIPTTLLFVGFILGGIPKVYSSVKDSKPNLVQIIIFSIMALVIILLPLINDGAFITLDINFWSIIILILVGVIAASAMVVPGVSGSMVLVILGYYYFITSELSNFIRHFITFDFSSALATLPYLIPFGVGVLFGIFGLSKLIKYLLKNYYSYVYYAILGLIVASPIPIIFLMDKSQSGFWTILIGIIMLGFGTIISINMTNLKELVFKSSRK